MPSGQDTNSRQVKIFCSEKDIMSKGAPEVSELQKKRVE